MQPTVSEVMTRSVVTVSPLATVGEALATAQAQDICHLVVARAGLMAGVTCVCQLRSARPDRPVHEVMATPVTWVDADYRLDDAAALMREQHIGCLPVKRDGRVVGIVTPSDLGRLEGGLRVAMPDDTCASCGSHHHVRADARTGVAECLDCAERARASSEEAELGAVD